MVENSFFILSCPLDPDSDRTQLGKKAWSQLPASASVSWWLAAETNLANLAPKCSNGGNLTKLKANQSIKHQEGQGAAQPGDTTEGTVPCTALLQK